MLRALYIVALFAALAGVCLGQSSAAFLDTTRTVDWTHAGIAGGVPSGSWAQCTTTACNTVLGAGASASADQVNAAFISCNTSQANTYILLQSAVYNMNKGLFPKSNCELRGTDPTNTILNFAGTGSCTGPASDVCFLNSGATYDNGPAVLPPCGGANSSNCATWATGYSKGTTSITLTSVGSNTPSVGGLLILDQQNDTSDPGGLIQCDTTGPCSGENPAFGRVSGGITRSQVQVVTITGGSCGGGSCSFTIDPPIEVNNIRAGQNPGAWWSGTNAVPIKNTGLRNLRINHYTGTSNSGAFWGIAFYDCLNCWLENVASVQLEVTGAPRNHILFSQSEHISIRNSYLFGSKGAEGSYGLECGETSDFLTENVIFEQIGSPVLYDNCTGGVHAYNFEWNNLYTINTNFLQTSLPSHDPGNAMNLFEGNYMPALDSDNQHGNSPLATVYRNWMPGNQPSPFNKTQQTQAFGVDAIARAWNVVGNVIGTPGYHNQYEVSPNTHGGSNANCNTSLFALGWGSVAAGCSTPGPGESANSSDLTVATSMMRWGNYVTVDPSGVAALRFDSTEASPGAITWVGANFSKGYFDTLTHTIPPSLYNAARPSWYHSPYCPSGVCTWPPVGPDVTGGQGPGGFAYRNIAYEYYRNGTFTGGVMNFNALVGYAATSSFPALTITTVPATTPPSVAFGFRVVNKTSPAQTFTLTNSGSATLNFSSTTLAPSGQFVISANTCGTTLAVSASCSISATFTPTSIGTKSATITIISDAPSSPNPVTLGGTGVPNIVTKVFDFGAPTGAVSCGLTTPVFQPNFAYTTLNFFSPTRAWVQPTSANGHFYKVTTAGTSVAEPSPWPTGSGSTVTSGTVTFTEQGSNNNKQCQDDFYLYIAPNIDGVVYAINANSVDPSNAGGTAQAAGGYTWTTVDSQINAFIAAPEWPVGGQIVELLRFISNGNLNSATPTYWLSPTYAATLGAATNDVCFCSTGQGATYEGDKPTGTNACFNDGADKTGFPVAWQIPVATGYNNLIASQVAHNNAASYASSIAYQRDSGGGPGGEAFPHCVVTLKSRFALTNATLKTQWVNNATQIYQHIASGLPAYPWMAATDGSCTPATSGCVVGFDWADAEASAAVALGAGIGSEGLSVADITSFNMFGYAQGGIGAANAVYSPGDYLYNFHANGAAAPKELQTIAASDPTGAGTGSLVDMLSYTSVLSPRPTSLELYHQDLEIAYDPNYPQYATYHAAYAASIANVRAGVVATTSGTTGISGSVSYSGSMRISGGANPNSASVTAGPPNYLFAPSTNSATISQLPSVIPSFAATSGPNSGNPLYGSGVTATTTEFGAAITYTRLTDLANNCNSSASSNFADGIVANSQDEKENHFNTNDTLVWLGATGGAQCIYSFVGSPMSITKLTTSRWPSQTGNIHASFTNANLYFSMNDNKGSCDSSCGDLLSWDFTGATTSSVFPSSTRIFSYIQGQTGSWGTTSANCLPTGYTVTWAGTLHLSKTPADQYFQTAYSNAGSQDTGVDLVVYKLGSGCWHLNTSTGVATGDWGYNGTVTGLSDRFKIHGTHMSFDGQNVFVSWSTCVTTCTPATNATAYLVNPTTGVLTVECNTSGGNKCTGHGVTGYSNFTNASGSPTFQEEVRAIAGSPNPATDLKANVPTCTGTNNWLVHQGWENDTVGDTLPFYETSYNLAGKTGTVAAPFTCPYQNEIDLVSPLGAAAAFPGGIVYREGHTFSSGDTGRAQCDQVIATGSQTGKYLLLETNWMGGFGSTAGGSSCSGSTCRCEVVGIPLQ